MNCPACGGAELQPCADLGEMPATCGVTWERPPAAAQAPLGRMDLVACPACAHAVNRAFRPELRASDGAFDNSMLASASYRKHVASVAERVLAHGTPHRTLELGCGAGELLERLPGIRDGWGHVETPVAGELSMRPAPWVPGDERYDLIVARHVLEHVPDPFELLCQLRSVATGRGYLEVPDGGYDLGQAGWDVIYPHVHYFHAGSLVAMCERAGFTVTGHGLTFHDQYLWVEVSVEGGLPVAVDNSAQLAVTAGLARRWDAMIADWRATLAAAKRPALWGAGARGVTFLATADPDGLLQVTDLNEGKHGRYLPTGHRVTAPAALAADTDLVITTNPAYRNEIAAAVAGLGLTAEVRVA
ncbi:class I SAM-dependent methyltransferase [Longispora albida]|uniref:class I SAM-dependent methyltransferase n=1 Tax=Longispora albida TaxID=203523 RepID=UPI0003758047|nr:class I SAM-dependent methyltransferase [Longispora albida]